MTATRKFTSASASFLLYPSKNTVCLAHTHTPVLDYMQNGRIVRVNVLSSRPPVAVNHIRPELTVIAEHRRRESEKCMAKIRTPVLVGSLKNFKARAFL